MEITNPTVTLLAITPDAEKLIEEAGRTCYLSADKMSDTTTGPFIRRSIKNAHLSIIEHASATFRITGASRSFTHQLVRHRVASFSQQSQRYVNEEDFNYIIPDSIAGNDQAAEIYREFMLHTQQTYKKLRSLNILKEDARFILPNALESEIVFTANFRELRHLFTLRLDRHAQWEIRKAAFAMLKIMMEKAPAVFGDFIPDETDFTASLAE
ncbi:MAG: FAD-dependent thymidylate synthase [Spirochaetes bacterium]|nr:FAD-dependent thymidylate synthase [Spirochaetota bacterium]